MKKKIVALVLVCVLVFGIAVGGTLAWLADMTNTVVNTFTVGDVEIEITETGLEQDDYANEYDLLPGVSIEKDPKVTVLAKSEKCYLFVKLEEDNNTVNTKKVLTYTVNTAENEWKAVEGNSGVYYRIVDKSASNQDFYVLQGNTVTVNSNLSGTDCEKLESSKPTLSITAYAVQFDGIVDVLDAWAAASNAANH